MLCAIIGDSIAVGTATQFHQCYHNAKVGIPSASVISRVPPDLTKWTVISAGSNDPYNRNLSSNLEKIRSRIHSRQVIWILPQNRHAADVVDSVAAKHGDNVVSFRAGKDHIHPKSYSVLASDIKREIR